MVKKKEIFNVNFDWNELDKEITSPSNNKTFRVVVSKALNTITKQLEVGGYSPRTILDYSTYVKHFIKVTKVEYVEEINTNHIYKWLDSMKVAPQTKLTRLKCLKAFLSRCLDNGWIKQKFWRSVTVKVPKKILVGATDREVNLLLSLLDFNDFVQLRDGVAVLLMYKTGIRVNTLVNLKESNIDLQEGVIRLDGDIMKNNQDLTLPLPQNLQKLIGILIAQNKLIRKEYRRDNDFVFITKFGEHIAKSPNTNNIKKRLNSYKREYGLNNINPHALRRGFAKNLLDKGVNIALISKALGHSDLAVTTQYLNIESQELVNSLRNYF